MNSTLDLDQYYLSMSEATLKLWNDLPDYPVYSDQLLQLVKESLSFLQTEDTPLITKSMVNNYVKWDIIPRPVKKKYERLHIAYIMIITILKQLLPISKIKEGIQLQLQSQGIDRAYDSFCGTLETSLKQVFDPVLTGQTPITFESRTVDPEHLTISAITTALANKLLSEKIIETKINRLAIEIKE